MKSLPSESTNNPVASDVIEGDEPMEDGFRLLAKIIASAIRRTNEAQAILRQSSHFAHKSELTQSPAIA